MSRPQYFLPTRTRPAAGTRSRRRLVPLLTASVVACTLGAAVAPAGAGPAAAPGSSDACPLAHDGPLVAGQEARGLTVASGTTPGPFGGSYVDTVPDGIGRGVDMLIFRLSGSRITHPDGTVDAGVWAGISGSPLYDAASGDLIGAVSYARAFGNDVVAGVTPAGAMYDGLLGASTADTAPSSVALGTGVRSALADAGIGATAGSSLRRLDSPTYVSGLPPRAASEIAAKARRTGTTWAAGVSAADEGGAAIPLVAGGNLATTWSYGDITTASVGTVTAICGDRVLAFGHPDLWEGESRQSIHGARALGIVANGGFDSFKDVAEIGAPVGALAQDRLVGIAGDLGAPPPAAALTTTTTLGGRELLGRTLVSEPAVLGEVTGMQLFSDSTSALDAMGQPGEALLRWTVSFDRADGSAGSFSRTQRYSSRHGIEWDVTADASSDVAAIVDNEFEDVTVTGVQVSDRLAEVYRAYRVGRIAVNHGRGFRTVKNNGTAWVHRGSSFRVRTTYVPANRWSQVEPVTRTTWHYVSPSARRNGRLSVAGNSFSWDDFGFFDEIGFGFFFEDSVFSPGPSNGPQDLDGMLATLRGLPRQDDATATLRYADPRAKQGRRVVSRDVRLPAVVTGQSSVRLRVAR